jgi:hypothetical protein
MRTTATPSQSSLSRPITVAFHRKQGTTNDASVLGKTVPTPFYKLRGNFFGPHTPNPGASSE